MDESLAFQLVQHYSLRGLSINVSEVQAVKMQCSTKQYYACINVSAMWIDADSTQCLVTKYNIGLRYLQGKNITDHIYNVILIPIIIINLLSKKVIRDD